VDLLIQFKISDSNSSRSQRISFAHASAPILLGEHIDVGRQLLINVVVKGGFLEHRDEAMVKRPYS
jgi:hypothetical protein